MVSCVCCVGAAAAIGGLVMATATASESLAATTAHMDRRNNPQNSGMPQDGQGFALALPQHRTGILPQRQVCGVLPVWYLSVIKVLCRFDRILIYTLGVNETARSTIGGAEVDTISFKAAWSCL